MSTPNERDETFVMLPDLALGTLPAAEAERLMNVVQTSPALQAELVSLRNTVAALGSAAPAATLAADRKDAIRSRLLARAGGAVVTPTGGAAVAASPAMQVHFSTTPATRTPASRSATAASTRVARPVSRVSQFLALAASVGLVASLVRLMAVTGERDEAREAYVAATLTKSQLTRQLASSDSLVAAMSGADVRVVELVSTQNMAPGARMFWDRVANRWTMVTHDLAPAAAGRTYQLWLVTTTSAKISAGTFNTDARGRALVQATYALGERDLAAIAITEEPAGGSAQPTGTILVAGAPTR